MRTRPFTLLEVQQRHTEAVSRLSPEQLVSAGADLGALAAAVAAGNVRAGIVASPEAAGLDTITSPDTRATFEKTFDDTTRLFERIGVSAPAPEELVAGSSNERGDKIDLTWLANEYERMSDEGLKPELVLAPQNMTLDQIKDLYDNLTRDSSILHNPLKKQSDGNGLYVDEKITDNWNSLTTNPVLRPNGTQVPYYTNTQGIAWTLRIVPGTPQPTKVSISHESYTADPDTPSLSSITEYLTLQATHIQNGESPIDGVTWSWCNGTFHNSSGGASAPRARWNSGYGRVRVISFVVGYSNAVLGVRPPVG